MREDTKFSSARLNQQRSSSLVVITSHTFLLNDINACMHKVLKLKVSFILGICCPQVEWKILQGEGGTKVQMDDRFRKHTIYVKVKRGLQPKGEEE